MSAADRPVAICGRAESSPVPRFSFEAIASRDPKPLRVLTRLTPSDCSFSLLRPNTMLRYWTAGESHGKALLALVDGFPAGVPIDTDSIDVELRRRQGGYGRGGRQRIETDRSTSSAASGTARRWAARSPWKSSTRTTSSNGWAISNARGPGTAI